MDNLDQEILKQDLKICDEMAKLPYKPEAWELIMDCMDKESCFKDGMVVDDFSGTMDLDNIVKLVEKTAYFRWKEEATQTLNNYGLYTSQDIKEIWDAYTRAGVLVDPLDGSDDEFIFRNLVTKPPF